MCHINLLLPINVFQLSSLEQVGYDSAVLLHNKSNGAAYKLGTDVGLQFLGSNPHIGLDFMSFVAGTSSVDFFLILC